MALAAETHTLLASPLGAMFRGLGLRSDLLPPVVRRSILLPHPERFYSQLGAPIETAALAGRDRERAACFAVGEGVRSAVGAGLERLMLMRASDAGRHLRETRDPGSSSSPGARAHGSPRGFVRRSGPARGSGSPDHEIGFDSGARRGRGGRKQS